MRASFGRTALGGFVGTLVMTLMMYFVAPTVLGMPMDVAGMLGRLLAGSWALGMAMHFVNGTVIFPAVYEYVLYRLLPGEPWLKGTIWGVVLWFLAQAVFMPVVGGGMFSARMGGLTAVVASLVAHLVYGALLGGIAGAPERFPSSPSPRTT
jgi:hypothetical protein